MTILILAGGKARRMGHRDKAFLKIDDVPIIKRQLGLIRKCFKKIIIVTNSPDSYRSLKGIRVIPDVAPDQGPLGGILSGLLASHDRYNFVVACDMPFINPGLMEYMLENSTGYDVVVPRVKRKYEPLFSIYSKSCIKHIKPFVCKKIFNVSCFFSKVRVREIGRKEIVRFAPPEKIFMNLNTPEDLLKLNG